jgi:hypothetical protein
VIRIKEERPEAGALPKVYLNVENKFELMQNSYPIVIRPKNLTHSEYHASIMEKNSIPNAKFFFCI